MFVVHDVLGGNKRLFEAAIDLAQFPEDQKKENRDYEQQVLDIHFLALPFKGGNSLKINVLQLVEYRPAGI